MDLLLLLAIIILIYIKSNKIVDSINEIAKRQQSQLPSVTNNAAQLIRGNRLMSSKERNAYLLSPQWQSLRQQVKARDKVCQLTGDTDNLEVHHTTYDNLGNEYLEDLVLLSRKAHQFVHDYYGSYDRYNTYPITEELRTAYKLNLLNNP